MADLQSRTRTNYFKVKDKEKFSSLLLQFVTGNSEPVAMMQDGDMVGFCCNSAVYGIKSDAICDKEIEMVKKGLFMDGMERICEFVGMDVSSWDKDAIDNAMDDTISQMPEEDFRRYVSQYVESGMEYEVMWDELVKRVQELLEPGHACIITDIGWEKLRYVSAGAVVITADSWNSLSLNDLALETARKALGDPKYSPKIIY